MIRTFTGPTRLTDAQEDWIKETLATLSRPTEIRTGCAPGLDSIAAEVSASQFPRCQHLLFVPSAWHNKKIVELLEGLDDIQIIECPRKKPSAMAYRARNEYMVTGQPPSPDRGSQIMRLLDPTDVLEAFVFRPTFYRSGEWMTINIAKKYHIQVNTYIIPEN
jgi:hypothetical protein